MAERKKQKTKASVGCHNTDKLEDIDVKVLKQMIRKSASDRKKRTSTTRAD